MAAPSITRLAQVPRNQGQLVPNFFTAPTWVDVVAVSSTSATYTIQAGAAFMRLSPTAAAGATYGSFVETASTPAAGKTDGSGSFPVPAGLCLVAPNTSDTLSLVSATSGYVTIEVWN